MLRIDRGKFGDRLYTRVEQTQKLTNGKIKRSRFSTGLFLLDSLRLPLDSNKTKQNKTKQNKTKQNKTINEGGACQWALLLVSKGALLNHSVGTTPRLRPVTDVGSHSSTRIARVKSSLR
jgi:hypothetical protein